MFKRAEEKGIKIEVTEKFKDRCVCCRCLSLGANPRYLQHLPLTHPEHVRNFVALTLLQP